MRYMMLIHHDEAAMAAADQKQLWADYAAFNEALNKAEGASGGEEGDEAAIAVAGDPFGSTDGGPLGRLAVIAHFQLPLGTCTGRISIEP